MCFKTQKPRFRPKIRVLPMRVRPMRMLVIIQIRGSWWRDGCYSQEGYWCPARAPSRHQGMVLQIGPDSCRTPARIKIELDLVSYPRNPILKHAAHTKNVRNGCKNQFEMSTRACVTGIRYHMHVATVPRHQSIISLCFQLNLDTVGAPKRRCFGS